MYGVPADLPLQPFVGTTLNQIAIGQFQIQFQFDKPEKTSDGGIRHHPRSISVQGGWQLHNSSGDVIDEEQEHAARRHYRFHEIIGTEVTAYRVDSPNSFCLVMSNGHILTICDDSPHYESFSIQPGDIYV